jgi:membrane-bound lytic murein transglycosylase B
VLAAALIHSATAAPVREFDLTRPDIQQFIAQASARTGMPAEQISQALSAAQPQPAIITAMEKPAERVLPWWQYRERFLQSQRIRDGLRFWQQHADKLAQVEDRYGVPAEYLLAILGVETQYGRVTGRYKVLDAVATLAFDYPPRAPYFQQELEQLLLLMRDDLLDIHSVRGSYAGAMGAPQFMPSSFRRHAIAAQPQSKPDLWNDWDDIFASVANYLVANGWQRGQAVMDNTQIDQEADDALQFKLALNDTVGTLRQRGYAVPADQADATPVVLVPAELADAMSWRIGYTNYYVITRYNRSARYAMVVHDLAQALRAAKDSHPVLP